MHKLVAYLSQDRRQVLAAGRDLPERTVGTALFADISGFTRLTEALQQAYGSRRGSELLSDRINQIYTALIAHIDAYRGSVLGFAGDAITCWFDRADGPAPMRATACALAMQQTMATISQISLPDGDTITLALKVALACGPARRLVVGEPTIQRLDLLAGATLARVATAEHHATMGEVVLDAACVAALGPVAQIGGWREDVVSGEHFAPLLAFSSAPPPNPWPALSTADLPPALLRPWVPAAIYTHEVTGQGAFLTELRPAVALFLRFGGIDYDAEEEVRSRLDAFICTTQAVLERFGGSLLQVVIGDKGSYLCCAFGAPVAHEDDARRAVLAALALHREATAAADLPPLQIGISQGTLRCGAYGADARRTYGILGDEVNLAARLMGLAAAGETLISAAMRPAVAAYVALEPRPPIHLKGKAEPLPVFAVSGLRQERAVRLSEPGYSLPMVGRARELADVAELMRQVLAGHGQAVAICAEAGLGKSRLLAEVLRLAQQHGMIGYGGACQSTGTLSPYLLWQPIWRAIFNLSPEAPLRRQIHTLKELIEEWAPERAVALPLLAPLLGLALPENDFTQALDAHDRQGALHALLGACLAAAATEAQSAGGGLLIVLEDVHWIDPASLLLLNDLAATLAELPVLLALAYRPLEVSLHQQLRLTALPDFHTINLEGLDQDAVAQLIRAKLLQLFPARGAAVPASLVRQLMARTQGNPFYIEEVLNYLHDRAIDPREAGNLADLELPESLQRLVLSRIDQLSEQQQIILKSSSVIGQRFLVAWLDGAFSELAAPEELRANLVDLERLELTPLDTPEPELAYLFKHVLTREVAYSSLGSATRAMLHEQLALYLETLPGANDLLLDLLAHHYDLSANLPKKRRYLRQAGQAAATRYANASALAYLGRALELAPSADLQERYALLLTREQVLALGGERDAQRTDLMALATLAEQLERPDARAEVALRQARLANVTGHFAEAAELARSAVVWAQTAGMARSEAAACHSLGWALRGRREYADAHAALERSLLLAEEIDDNTQRCATLNALSAVAADQGHYAPAQDYLERSLAIAHTSDNRRMESYALADLANLAGEQGRLSVAVSYLQQGLSAARMIGDRWLEGRTLGNLGFAQVLLGNYHAAQAESTQSLVLARTTADQQQQAYSYGTLGLATLGLAELEGADEAYQQGLALAEALDDQLLRGLLHRGLGQVALARGDLAAAAIAYEQAVTALAQLDAPALLAEPLAGLARVALAQGDAVSALARIEPVLAYLEAGKLDGAEEPMLVYLTCIQALRACADPRATTLLTRARHELLARAAMINDPSAFLEQVSVHRELLEL